MGFPNLSCFYSGVSGIGTQTRDSQSGRLSVGMEKTPFSQQHTIMIPHSIQYQYNQYHSLVVRYWNQMTPMQYCGLLISIAVAGWLLMKSVSRK